MGGSCTAFCKKLGNSILEAILHENRVFCKRRQNLSHTSYVAGGDKHCAYETIAKASGGSVFEKVQCLSKAFTLAEVLIVLGIIGLIADMTIPTLISNTQEKIATVQLKKFYSGFENAYRLAVSEEGTPDNWNLIAKDSREGAANFVNKMKPYLKIFKDCGIDGGCFFNGNYKNLDGSIGSNFSLPSWGWSTFQLPDGASVLVQIASPDCSHNDPHENICAWIFVDINGFKKPNTGGMDFFTFFLTKRGLVPAGIEADKQFEEDCIKRIYGNSCAAWIIYNENMDYLHCDDLSWSGKRKCD